MKKVLNILTIILLCASFIYAGNNQSTKIDDPKIEDFSVNIELVEFSCEGSNATLIIMLNQTIQEIERVSNNIVATPNALSDSYQKIENYHLINMKTGDKINPSSNTLNGNFLYFHLNSFDPRNIAFKEGFLLISRGQQIKDNKLKANPVSKPVSISDSCYSPITKLGEPSKTPTPETKDLYKWAKKNLTAPQDAKKPEIKVSFAIDGQRKVKRYFQTEIQAEPFELKRLGVHGAYSIVPIFLNLEKRGTPNKEVDKLNFGSKIRHSFIFNDDGRQISEREPKPKMIAGFKSELSAKIETTSKFDEVNFIGSVKSGIPLNVFQTRSQSLRVTPYIGFEMGYKIRNKANDSKIKWIARPLFGAELYWTPFRSQTDTPFVVEAKYIRRMFLKPELIYDRDDKGEEFLELPSTNPKDYFDFKVTFFRNKLISPFVKYTIGRDAPKFLLEDSSYGGGIQINVDFAKKKN